MNLITAIYAACAFLASQGIYPSVEYIKNGEMVYADGCLVTAVSDGALLWCQKDNLIMAMPTN